MREIKFRSIIPSVENPKEFYTVYYSLCSEIKDVQEHIKYMLKKWLSEGNNPDQYIGLKDKSMLKDIFECDIICSDCLIIGNIYENENLLKENSNFIVEGLGTKEWKDTEQALYKLGCKYA